MAAVVQNSLSGSLCSTFCDGGKENKAGWAIHKWNSGCWHRLGIRCWGYRLRWWIFWIWRRTRSLSTRRRTPSCNKWRRITNLGPPQGRNIKIHPFVVPAKGLKNSEAPHINKDISPLAVLMLFFKDMFLLLVEQTNLSYQQHLDRQAGPSRRLPDIMTFTTLALQMGHIVKDTLHDYWSRLKQMHTPFYGETMTRDKFLQIPLFLHFADNSRRPDQGEEYDRLWKIRTVFVTLNQAYSKFYSPSEHLTVDEVIVKFQGWVIFRQYIPKKRKRFGIKIYKLCDKSGYT